MGQYVPVSLKGPGGDVSGLILVPDAPKLKKKIGYLLCENKGFQQGAQANFGHFVRISVPKNLRVISMGTVQTGSENAKNRSQGTSSKKAPFLPGHVQEIGVSVSSARRQKYIFKVELAPGA